MQLKILNFFGNFSSPFLDRVVQFITMFGEESLFIVVIVFLLWCFSKRKGFTLFSTLFSALLAMGIIKAVVRYPRPFQVHPEIGAQRLSTATGYSFPSGHSTGAASFYGSVALAFKKQYLSIISALLIVLVALSRLYLKVHWPLDVFGGVTLGLVASFVLYNRFETLYDDEKKLSTFSLGVGIGATTISLLLAILMAFANADTLAFSDPMKLLALAGGGYLGFFLEFKKVKYTTDGSVGLKVVRFLIGLIILLAIQFSKAVVGGHFVTTFFRYWLVGFWATFIYPFLGSKIRVSKESTLFSCQK
jgi:membrane-associated phospholipid phosphatase